MRVSLRHRRPAAARLGIVAVAATTATAGLVGAGSASGTPSAPTAVRAAAPRAAPQDGGPTLPPFTPDYAVQMGTAGISGRMLSVKPKLRITLSNMLTLAYIAPWSEFGDGTPKKAINARQPPCATTSDYALDGQIPVDVYAVTNTPGAKPYGVFPPTHVSMLAFGSIPVSATLHLSQVVTDGQLQPIKIVQYIAAQGPHCDPDWPNQVPAALTVGRGDVDVALSDVTVDGQAVDVGPDCRSTTPAHLNMWGDDGYFPWQGGVLHQRPDLTTRNGYLVHPGASDLQIPSFTGCGTGGDDISRLITSMVSGGGNELAIAQGNVAVGPPDSPFDPDDPDRCVPNDQSPTGKTCPTPPDPPVIPIPSK